MDMAMKASVRDVRRTNRALLVRRLVLSGATSRSALGDSTGLSGATVTNVISELIGEAIVQEEGFLDSVGGRRRVVVAVNKAAAVAFGSDISETHVTTEAFDLTLNRLARRSIAFPDRRITPERVMEVLHEQTSDMLAELDIDRKIVLGLGLGVPGIVENSGTASESVIHAPAIGWEAVRLSGLENIVGFQIYVDNGAKTTTQAESWYGAARGSDHAIVVLIGAGAGAGIVTNGRLYRGFSSSAGEWGHTKISLTGRQCICGSYGCVETFVGASAALHDWTQSETTWAGRETEGIAAMFAAIGAGDKEAERVMRTLIEHLGFALSNLINMYNPETIVVSGWFGDQLAEHYLDEIASASRRFSLEQPGSEAVLKRSKLGQDAVALGAATLPLDRFIEMGWPQ